MKIEIVENFLGEEIDISNDDIDVNVEHWKKWGEKELIIRNCPNLKAIKANKLCLKGLKIENCPKLEHLSAYHNEITELDLTGLSNLKTVYVPHNSGKKEKVKERKGRYVKVAGLKNINLNGCKNLESLNVSNCNLNSLNLIDNKKLKDLDCNNNSIKELEVKHLKELEILYCFKCFLTELDCSNLGKLSELNCHGNGFWKIIDEDNIILNQLKKIILENCKSLNILDCAENSLKKLDLVNLPSLNFVSCKENCLKQLKIADCSKLDYLDISYQFDRTKETSVSNLVRIDVISSKLRKLFCDVKTSFFSTEIKKMVDWNYFLKLELLEIGEEKLVKFKDEFGKECEVISYFVKKIPEFEEYLAKKRQKQQQEDEAYHSDEENKKTPNSKRKYHNEYENQAWLSTWLELKALKDKEIFDNLNNYKNELKDLDLSWQNLTGKLVIGNWTNLKSLNVSNNELKELIVKDCPKLERIIFSHNQLKKVEVSGCPNINYQYSFNSDNFVNPIEENLEDEKAQELLKKEKTTFKELLTLDFGKLSEVIGYQIIKLAEKLLTDFTLDQLAGLNPADIPRELVPIIVKLYDKKLRERFPQFYQKKEKKTDQKPKKDNQALLGLIKKAEKALREKDLEKLKELLKEIKKHANNKDYTSKIAKLEQGLINLSYQSESNDKSLNIPLIIGISAVSMGLLTLFAFKIIKNLKKIIFSCFLGKKIVK